MDLQEPLICLRVPTHGTSVCEQSADASALPIERLDRSGRGVRPTHRSRVEKAQVSKTGDSRFESWVPRTLQGCAARQSPARPQFLRHPLQRSPPRQFAADTRRSPRAGSSDDRKPIATAQPPAPVLPVAPAPGGQMTSSLKRVPPNFCGHSALTLRRRPERIAPSPAKRRADT